MKTGWGLGLIACLVFLAASVAVSQASAQCTVANCPAGSNIVTAPPYTGTNGPDCFIGTAGADIMRGRGGNDFMCGGGGNDSIFGGSGQDTILGEDGDDELRGNGAVDTIFGGAGDDTILGGGDDDFLFGEAGADTIEGGNGDDFIFGADGNDILRGTEGADSLFGGDGDDQLEGGGGDDPVLEGGPGNDTINGGSGNDIANGGPGTDFINGGGNNDTLNGGDGPDIINGDAGNDTLSGDSENDRLDGGTGINQVIGGAGIDVCLNAANMDPSCELFTHASLESFGAFEDDKSAILRWVTSSETGTLGFYLYRARDGEWEAAHEGILPALLASPQGGVYDFRDTAIDRGEAQQYLLIEVDARGVQSTHGPFDVEFSATGTTILDRNANFARKRHRLDAIGRSLKSANTEKQSAGVPVALYFGVEATGLYRVSAAEIASRFGLPESEILDRIQVGQLLLTEEGEAVAWTASADGTELRFFGQERESLYTSERIYRLSLDAGTTMSERSVAPGVLIDGLTFETELHLEENSIPGVLIAADPDEDYWFWQLISAAPSLPASASVSFDLESVAAGGALRIDLHGISDKPHSVEVRLNGAWLGRIDFEGIVPHVAILPVPDATLEDGTNTLTIVSVGSVEDMLYLDSADLGYTRSYPTSEPSLLFVSEQDASLEITGLTGTELEAFDVTDPRLPLKLDGAVSAPSGLQLAAEAGRSYFGVRSEEAQAPSSIWNDVPSTLRDATNAADYVIIAPASLVAQAHALADYRASDGFTTAVVELQDIYDEFAYGTPDPRSIRAFLGYAHRNWAVAPEFVVLVGKGSFDYRGIYGLGGNLLPPIMAHTLGGILSSDTKYADILGDDALPDLALGRLPVTSAAELESVIQQIIVYEEALDSTRNEITLLADATDAEGDFGMSSDSVIEVLPNDWSASAVYRSELGDLESTRALFFDEMRKGPRVLSYLGHAGITALGRAETLFSVDDLETMEVEGAQPIFADMTCVASRFAVPGLVSLDEAMLIDDEGAIAVWGASGLSVNELATLLARELVTELSSGGQTRLGPLIDHVLPTVADLEFGRDMIEIYHLFGDPALRIAKSDGSGGTGGAGGSGGSAGSAGSGGNAGTSGSNVNLGSSTAGCSVAASEHAPARTLLALLGLSAFALRRRRRANSRR